MICFLDLSIDELSSNGLNFETVEEYELFARIIFEEFERRTTEALTKKIGKTRSEGFSLRAGKEAVERLETDYPECKNIIRDIQQEMTSEIMRFKDRIPGLINADSDTERKTVQI